MAIIDCQFLGDLNLRGLDVRGASAGCLYARIEKKPRVILKNARKPLIISFLEFRGAEMKGEDFATWRKSRDLS
jgi:hypothetical protein